MIETELAWAAGFFDGEGSSKRIYNHYTTKKGEVRKPTSNVVLSVAQTALKPLERFKEAVGGIGHINGPYKYRANQRPYWVWSASYFSGRLVFKRLEKYLCSIKKEQYFKVSRSVTNEKQ